MKSEGSAGGRNSRPKETVQPESARGPRTALDDCPMVMALNGVLN